MINFTETNMPAKNIALHYAKKLNNQLALNVFKGNSDIASKEEAIEFAEFFWTMTDESVEDYEKGIEVAGETDLVHWMEKLMNITIGYMNSCGYKEQWTTESNRINGRGQKLVYIMAVHLVIIQ